MNTRILLAVLCTSLEAVSIAGCGTQSSPTAPTTLTAASVTQAVHQAGRSQPPGADKDVIVGFDGFKRVLQARIPLGTAKPGAPVAWTFRHLCDNEVAKVSMTSQYTVTRVIPRGPVVRYPS